MEVVVKGQTITEEEYLSGSWTNSPEPIQTGSRPGAPLPTPSIAATAKRKPLPKLPPADYKVIIRPQTAASLLHHGATELFKAVCAAAQVNPTEVVAEDQLRLHPTNNTALISTPSLDRAGRYIKLQVVKIGQQEIQFFAYAPAPENSTKGILHHTCSDEDDAAIWNELRARNKGIDVVGARRLGKSRHIVTIFAGPDRPDYVRYWGATYVVYPFRDRIEACYNCRKVGHRTDVCPQQRQARCKRCGDETHATPEWGTKPTCLARCIVCKGGHPTCGRNCKFKYYSQVQQHNNNSKNSTGTKGTTVVIGQQQGGDQENTTRITSAIQPNSQSTGYRDAVRGTPLTEASQARQENATVLQQAPSGSREHSSSRGRAAAHAVSETVRGLVAEVKELKKQLEAANNKTRALENPTPARLTLAARETAAYVHRNAESSRECAMQETLKTFHDMLKNEIRNMIPTLGNNIETPSTSPPLVIASANQTGGPQNGRGIPNGAADARSTLLQDAEEFTTYALAEEDGPRPDAKLITLLENQQTLQAEWLKRKHDRQLKPVLAQAETEVQKYSEELRSAQWMQLCNRLNGQLGSKNPCFLFRHLLDPDNSKEATAKKRVQ
ncbi:hypothetical protein HPB52_009412 [Rhipicephalus sanguineus]|uniref:CCHC-type domain-containing protein n=1 Tax=Rhipicephalus sanguineus TaxID=34632 RepID=A0A9D4PRA6_RHISA|nr:hypothetical protein HPB52_009412 [Rhipicephalus sanguineus]